MAKFAVMVNGKWMVMIELEDGASNAEAEYYVFDLENNNSMYNGCINACQAFNAKEMRGEFFVNCLMSCHTISERELVERIKDYNKVSDLNDRIADKKDAVRELNKQIKEHEQLIETLQKQISEKHHIIDKRQEEIKDLEEQKKSVIAKYDM